MPVLREVAEVYAQGRDDRNVRLRETLTSLHRFHIAGQSGELGLDERHRVDSEDRQDQIDAGDCDPNPATERDTRAQCFGKT